MCEIGSLNISQESIVYDILNTIYEKYAGVHPYLAAIICVLGVFMNIASVVVLTRPTMIVSPINCLLVVIAACDILTMLSCFNYVMRILTFTDCPTKYTYEWIATLLIHSNLSVIGHTVSIWLTVFMAIIRACTVKNNWHFGGGAAGGTSSGGSTGDCRAPPAALWISLGVLGVVVLLNTPGFFTFTIDPRPIERLCPEFSIANYSPANATVWNRTAARYFVYSTKVSDAALWNDCLLLKVTFWINGVLFKLLPCILLSVFIGVLICVLAEVRERRVRLRLSSDNSRTDRTTSMLIVLLTVFLISELPQGILAIGTGIFNQDFRHRVYRKLGDVMDVLSLINSSANFVVYFAMSQKFREVFCRTLVPAKWRSGEYSNLSTENRAIVEMTTRAANGFSTRSFVLTDSTRKVSRVTLSNATFGGEKNGAEKARKQQRLSLPTWKR